MPTISIRLEGAEALQGRLRKLLGVLNTRDLLDASGAVLLNRIRTRFLQQVGPDGKSWQPTTRTGQRKGGGILYDTGRLFHSLQYAVMTDGEAAIGTDVPYGKFHQFGTNKMPARTFLGVSEDDISPIQKLIIDRIEGAMK
jgi:phage virion morphogenesis protein